MSWGRYVWVYVCVIPEKEEERGGEGKDSLKTKIQDRGSWIRGRNFDRTCFISYLGFGFTFHNKSDSYEIFFPF